MLAVTQSQSNENPKTSIDQQFSGTSNFSFHETNKFQQYTALNPTSIQCNSPILNARIYQKVDVCRNFFQPF